MMAFLSGAWTATAPFPPHLTTEVQPFTRLPSLIISRTYKEFLQVLHTCPAYTLPQVYPSILQSMISTRQSHLRLIKSFPSGTSGKETACQCRRHERLWFHPWVRKISWSRTWQPTPAFLLGKFHRRRRLVGYARRGCRAGHGWAHTHPSRVCVLLGPSGNLCRCLSPTASANLTLFHPILRLPPTPRLTAVSAGI